MLCMYISRSNYLTKIVKPYLLITIYHLVGGIPTPLKECVCQLG